MLLVLTLAAAALIALGLALKPLLQPNRVGPRMARLRSLSLPEAPSSESRGILAEGERGLAERALSALAGRALDEASPVLARTRQRLIRAGYRRPSTLRIYLGSRVALALLLPLLALNALQTDMDSLRLSLLLCLSAAAGMVLPSFLLDRAIASRQRRLQEGLPDALDLMVVCIEAGLGLTASIARVASEYSRGRQVLAEEFELVALEAQAGKSNVDALRGLAERTGLAEVGALVAMLIQTERFGTSVADALRVHSAAMRSRRSQRAEECAAKAPLKMLFPAGLFIFPATLLVIAGPGVIRLIATLQGG